MKKKIVSCRKMLVLALVAMVALMALVPCAAEGISIFEPKNMMEAYNDNIGSFFEILMEGAGDHSNFDRDFKVTLKSEADGEVVYENNDGSIVVTYYTSDENTPADKLYFWTSGKSVYRNIPQLVFGWAVSNSHADGVNDLDLLYWLNDSTNRDTYTCDLYTVTYDLVKDEYYAFLVTRN